METLEGGPPRLALTLDRAHPKPLGTLGVTPHRRGVDLQNIGISLTVVRASSAMQPYR